MTKINIIKCDGCGKLIEDSTDAYMMDLRGSSYWVLDGYEFHEINLHFCRGCAFHLMDTLKRIIKNIEKE